jgi:serine/threonine protein kinase
VLEKPRHPAGLHAPRPQGNYTERDAAAIIRSVLQVVAYAHDMGVVHRDIKVCLGGVVKLDQLMVIEWNGMRQDEMGRYTTPPCHGMPSRTPVIELFLKTTPDRSSRTTSC